MESYEFNAAKLSEREKEVVIKIAQGYSVKEISLSLHLSYHTIISHKKNIYSKTGITALPQVGIYAERKGWLVGIPLKLSSDYP